MRRDGKVYNFVRNPLGDVIAITDGMTLVAKYEYDAWGNHKVYNPNGTENTSSTFIGNINPIRYRGYYYDVESGLYYLLTRYYDPSIGQFISLDHPKYLDPTSLTGLNLYAYCGNSPVMYVDPTGTTKWWEWALLGVATTALIAGAIALTIVSGGLSAGLLAPGLVATIPAITTVAEVGAAVLTGAAIASAAYMSSSIESGQIDWGQYGVQVGIGAASGALSFGAGKILSGVGQMVGMQLGSASFLGTTISKIISSSTLSVVGGKVAELAGGFAAGIVIDYHLNNLFDVKSNLTNLLTGGKDSTWFSILTDLVNELLW